MWLEAVGIGEAGGGWTITEDRNCKMDDEETVSLGSVYLHIGRGPSSIARRNRVLSVLSVL